MFSTHKGDFAALILRIALGVMLLVHGLIKLLVISPYGTENYFTLLGLPPIFGMIIMIFEIIAGILLLIGFLSRIISIILIIEMLCILNVHFHNGFIFSNAGGGWEYPAMIVMTALALFFLGNGCYSLPIARKKLGKY